MLQSGDFLIHFSVLFRSMNSSMRAAIYARVSTKDQSCDMQMRDLRAYCAARGFTIIREYIDIGQSGAKDSRPELNELMADARKRKFEAILVWRFDRFARSTKHLCWRWRSFARSASSSSATKKTSTRAARCGRHSSPSCRPWRN